VCSDQRAVEREHISHARRRSRLEELIARTETLAKQQQGGYLARRASAARRRALRRRIREGLLRHLVTCAEVAAADAPQLALGERFRLPKANATNEDFRTLARKMLEQGQAQRELLVARGLAEKLLDDLAAALDEFDASLVESNEGRREHVGARGALAQSSRELTDLVDLLDGLNRYRFESNAELRAAWESARNVVSAPRGEGGVVDGAGLPVAPAAPAPPPVAGEVKPAA
jgi:hypothetical protein